MKEQLKYLFIGVDLHKQHHTAVIINFWNEKLGEIRIGNKPTAFPELLIEVKKHMKRGMTPIYGLEDTGGYGRALAVFLKENKQVVKEVNPALANNRRKSHAIIEKSDSWDAECVARVLKDELHHLPDANPMDIYWAISQLVTTRRGLVKDLYSHVRKLHQQLGYHYPSYGKFFSEIDGKTALAFWENFPAPHHLREFNNEQLAKFLRTYSNNGLSTKKAAEILRHIQGDGETHREFQERRDFIVQSMVRTISFNKEEIARVDGQLQDVMGRLNLKLESMTGIDHVTAAYFTAEIGSVNRFASADKMARFAGIAPIIVGSGNTHKIRKNKLGDRDLHDLFEQLAVRQIAVTRGKKEPRNPYFYNYYQERLAAGKTKKQAIICIMRKLVNIIYRMMKEGTEYKAPTLPIKVAG
ncbi:IS110 family transposase [Paenibacillus sp. HWE-109]|uniref:IS110 family transposase n=1 Tax=Paenibacillus sp. HWE-109 TaxID=1306526 RepID=UPI001EDD802F|nr:IS110 family transposase [Paenibacillus sp. HWE-109]UKS27380.1 IS110 family transposase [Paenibacillus sp. HWE-109]